MCKKLIASVVAIVLCPMAGPSIDAQELTGYAQEAKIEGYSLFYDFDYFFQPDFSNESAVYSIEDGKGFAYRLAQSREGATLGLFVKNSASESYDITGTELNAIAPAAGIQLTFDLSL
ncbi:MAG: hypothetical protein DHS20C02_03030 [Micavibrio sp.]|nr:MAG: hypothetical protein DHS20C02_03030 [Micavibrio sp.]